MRTSPSPGALLITPMIAAIAAVALALAGAITSAEAVAALLVGSACEIAALLWVLRFQDRLHHLSELTRPWLDAHAPSDPIAGVETALANIARQFDTRSQEARADKSQLQAILSGMVEGVIVLDRHGTIQLANSRAAQIFDVADATSLRGTPILQLSRDPDLQRLVKGVAHHQGGDALAAEIMLGSRPLHETLNVTATVVPAEVGQPALSILVFHDVTALKRLEAARSDFVANVSHEIRTPLTAIRGYAETLRAGAVDDPEKARQFLGVIERHSERLSRLTDDLLALSDLELGRAALHRAPMNVVPAIEAAIDVVRERARRGAVTLRKQIGSELPPMFADSDRVVQVLVNLVDNAVKYTEPNGTVTVSAVHSTVPPDDEANGSHAPRGWVELRVEDTGVGIPSGDLPRLTERFYRVDKARSRELGGTGLGLAIVKHIVQAHGGVMKIDSALGKGTTVRVYLPTGADAS